MGPLIRNQSQQQEPSTAPISRNRAGEEVCWTRAAQPLLHSPWCVPAPGRAAGHSSMWTGRQFCWLPLALQAKVQAEAGLVGFLSPCQPLALRGHCKENASQIRMRSHLFTLSSTSGVGLKETPSVRCYGVCAAAKESERERERKSKQLV